MNGGAHAVIPVSRVEGNSTCMLSRSRRVATAQTRASSRPYALFGVFLLLFFLFAYQRLTASLPEDVELVGNAANGGAIAAAAPLTAPSAPQPLATVPAPPAPPSQPALAGLVLKGIFADGSGGGSIILGSASGDDRVARLGAELAPGLRLTRIGASYAVMSGNGGSIRMEIGKGAFLPIEGAANASVPSEATTSSGAAAGPLSENPLGLQPVRSNGRIEGFAITAATSLPQLGQAGLQLGDVLVAVNGQAFESEEKVLELSNEISTARTAEFEYVRAGKRLKSSVRIQ